MEDKCKRVEVRLIYDGNKVVGVRMENGSVIAQCTHEVIKLFPLSEDFELCCALWHLYGRGHEENEETEEASA